MSRPHAADVRATVNTAMDLWSRLPDDAWDAPAFGLDWSCRETAAHVLDDLGGYAMQLSRAGGQESGYVPLQEFPVGQGRPEFIFWPEVAGGTAGIVACLDAVGGLLEAVVASVPADRRGWHPSGTTDASGFAALGITELALHSDDLLRAHGARFAPPTGVVEGVLARLFPHISASDDHWLDLLAATSRTEETAGLDWTWDSSVRPEAPA